MKVNIVFHHYPVNDLKTVIPVKAGIQIQKTGFRIKSGMTRSVSHF